eukprot:581278_1
MASTVITTNVIVCYFHPDSSGLATAFKDKRQTSFLLQFLKVFSPQDIECRPNWLEITCHRQVSESEVTNINQKLQSFLNEQPQYQPLRNCQIMLKITFDLCRLLEGVEYIRDQYKAGQVRPSQIDNYLLQISQQIKAISPTNNIKNDLFLLNPPPKKVLEKNKRRISIADKPKKDTQIDHETSKALDKAKLMKQIQRSDLMDKRQCKQLFYHIDKPTRTYLPVASNEMYPVDLYNRIEHCQTELVRYDYNTNSNSDVAIYPNDTKYSITLQDFADRKFHINNNIVKRWITDRAYLMEKMEKKENQREDDEKQEDLIKAVFRKFAIVDVRCHDFVGGNIPYCIKCEYDGFEAKLNDLLKLLEHESDVVFHCMYSQHRGPRAAYWYWRERRKWENKYKNKLHTQRVWVLDGGFKQWISDYVLDCDLVCNFDAKYWDDEYFPLTGREFFYRNDWKPQQTD